MKFKKEFFIPNIIEKLMALVLPLIVEIGADNGVSQREQNKERIKDGAERTRDTK